MPGTRGPRVEVREAGNHEGDVVDAAACVLPKGVRCLQPEDSVDNFTEYLFGGNPTNHDSNVILPSYGVEGSWLEYVYRRRSDYQARGLVYTVEASTNLVSGTWTTNGVLDAGSGSIDSELDVLTNRIYMGEHTAQYMRLQVKENED